MKDNEVRIKSGQTLEETIKECFDSDIEDSETAIYTGIVVDNNDPDKQGKCRIRVYSIFGDDIPDEDLPWALPDFSFVGSEVGNFIVPPIGAIVNVYFDKGDIYLPHYTTKAVRKSKQPTQKDIDYPDNIVMWETDDGDYFTLNRKTKETTFNHNSGTKVLIKKDGSVEITIVADKTETVQGKEESNITGNLTIKSDADITIESVGVMRLNHTGNLKVQGLFATPVPQGGPLCALGSCLYTGAPHSGNDAPTGPSVP